MPSLDWSPDLAVGNAFIDHDHRKLFDMFHRLETLVAAGRGSEATGKVVYNLVHYAHEHFDREERLMREIGYPGYAEHKSDHEKFTRQVEELAIKLDEGRTSLAIDTLYFLRDWLAHHIGERDRDLARAAHDSPAARLVNFH